MTTEICIVHNLWIMQIAIIPRAKSHIQNCLSDGFRERTRITHKATKPLDHMHNIFFMHMVFSMGFCYVWERCDQFLTTGFERKR